MDCVKSIGHWILEGFLLQFQLDMREIHLPCPRAHFAIDSGIQPNNRSIKRMNKDKAKDGYLQYLLAELALGILVGDKGQRRHQGRCQNQNQIR